MKTKETIEAYKQELSVTVSEKVSAMSEDQLLKHIKVYHHVPC